MCIRDRSKVIYETMKRNQKLAKELNRTSCQATGVLQFWVKCGVDCPLIGEVEGLRKEAVVKSTFEAPLRHNSVETFDEFNTGLNVGKEMCIRDRNMTTFVLMKPPKASAGVLMPVRISARMMPVEMTENGTLPYTKAMIVTSRMTRVISNGLIWVVLLWITSTLQMQSSGKGCLLYTSPATQERKISIRILSL